MAQEMQSRRWPQGSIAQHFSLVIQMMHARSRSSVGVSAPVKSACNVCKFNLFIISRALRSRSVCGGSKAPATRTFAGTPGETKQGLNNASKMPPMIIMFCSSGLSTLFIPILKPIHDVSARAHASTTILTESRLFMVMILCFGDLMQLAQKSPIRVNSGPDFLNVLQCQIDRAKSKPRHHVVNHKRD